MHFWVLSATKAFLAINLLECPEWKKQCEAFLAEFLAAKRCSVASGLFLEGINDIRKETVHPVPS